MTHADAIRNMTDKELAEFMTVVAKQSAEMLCKTINRKWLLDIKLSGCDFELLTETHQEWLAREVRDA